MIKSPQGWCDKWLYPLGYIPRSDGLQGPEDDTSLSQRDVMYEATWANKFYVILIGEFRNLHFIPKDQIHFPAFERYVISL